MERRVGGRKGDRRETTRPFRRSVLVRRGDGVEAGKAESERKVRMWREVREKKETKTHDGLRIRVSKVNPTDLHRRIRR